MISDSISRSISLAVRVHVPTARNHVASFVMLMNKESSSFRTLLAVATIRTVAATTTLPRTISMIIQTRHPRIGRKMTPIYIIRWR